METTAINSRRVTCAVLVAAALGGCAQTKPLVGSVSGVAAPLPVMLGPVRCIGTCGPEPEVTFPYGKDLVTELASHAATSSTSNGTTTTTSTTTQAGSVLFAYALLTPLLEYPFSPRSVAQLDSLRLGRASDSGGGGTDHRGDLTRLLVIGNGHYYFLPPPIAAPPPRIEPPPPPPTPSKPPRPAKPGRRKSR